MSELIVLGLIPGTNIRISFLLWAVVVLGVIVIFLVRLGHRRNAFRNWLVTIYLVLVLRRRVLQP
jgi:hypothetical protein